MSKSQEADEIFGCMMMFVGIGLAMGFLFLVVVPVWSGEAPTWKVWLFIAGMIVYGILGGLGKAFEAGFSSKNFLSFFWKRREQESIKTEQSTESDD